MYSCPNCNKELLWGGDHTYEDYGLEGDGMVTNCTCHNEECDITDVLIYQEYKHIKI